MHSMYSILMIGALVRFGGASIIPCSRPVLTPRNDSLYDAQMTLDIMLSTLEDPVVVEVEDLFELLTPLEICRIGNSHNFSKVSNITFDREQYLASLQKDSDVLNAGCPLPADYETEQPHCSIGHEYCGVQYGLPLFERTGFFSIFPELNATSLGTFDAALSFLTSGNFTVHIIGDSKAMELGAESQCHVHRVAYHKNRTNQPFNIEIAQQTFQTNAIFYDGGHAQVQRAVGNFRTMLEHAAEDDNAIVLLKQGVRYNHGEFHLYEEYLRAALPLLDQFHTSMGCKSCVAMVVTSPTQHYPKVLCRDFGGPKTRTGFTGNYPCKPLEQKSLANVSEDAPICWRDTEIYKLVNELNLTNIIIANVAKPDAAFWDVHIGDRMKISKGPISDCTHNCLGLFNQDHVWWAIHNVAKHLSRAK